MARKDKFLEVLLDKFLSIYPFVYHCDNDESLQFHGNNSNVSQQSILQGDPLGPVMFCILLHCFSISMESELNIWFLDDASLEDDPSKVWNDLNLIISSRKKLD